MFSVGMLTYMLCDWVPVFRIPRLWRSFPDKVFLFHFHFFESKNNYYLYSFKNSFRLPYLVAHWFLEYAILLRHSLLVMLTLPLSLPPCRFLQVRPASVEDERLLVGIVAFLNAYFKQTYTESVCDPEDKDLRWILELLLNQVRITYSF